MSILTHIIFIGTLMIFSVEYLTSFEDESDVHVLLQDFEQYNYWYLGQIQKCYKFKMK